MCQYCIETAALDIWFEKQNLAIYAPDAEILAAELASEIINIDVLLTHQNIIPAPLLCWRLGQAGNQSFINALGVSGFTELTQSVTSTNVNWLQHFPALFTMLGKQLANEKSIDWNGLSQAVVAEAEQLLGLLLAGLNNEPLEPKLTFRQEGVYYLAGEQLIAELQSKYRCWSTLFDENVYYIHMATEVLMRARPYSHVLASIIYSLLPCDCGYALGWQRLIAKHIYVTYNHNYLQQNIANIRTIILIYLCFNFKHDQKLLQIVLTHFQEYKWFDSEYISRGSAIEFVKELR